MQRKYNVVDNSPPVIHCFQRTVAEFVMQRKNTQWFRPMVSSGERNGMWCKWSHVRPVLVAFATYSFLKYAIISQTSAHQSEEKRSLGSRLDDYGPCLSFEIFNAAREKRDFSFMTFFLARKSCLFYNPHIYEQINALALLSRCEHFRWCLSCLARMLTKRKSIRSWSSKISLCIRKWYPSISLCFSFCNARESSAAIVTTYHDFKRMKVSLVWLLYFSNLIVTWQFIIQGFKLE